MSKDKMSNENKPISETPEKEGNNAILDGEDWLKPQSAMNDLFELVPCFITVQDRDFRLLKYNREFSQRFDPKPGAYCYNAYKDRTEKCLICPVEKTFQDGKSHWSEEKGYNKDGSPAYWVVKTAPIRNSEGEVIAAMEMCLDITPRKLLEEELKRTEMKYQAIFNNIPNPVFVVNPDTFEIMDCNQYVESVYGSPDSEMLGKSFLGLFRSEQREDYALKLRSSAVIDQAKHVTKDGRTIFVGIRISPFEFYGRRVLLVTTSDITQRLEAEQQLIQASKMTTMGEMATGIAHELNQPLSVIKTASSFFMRKIGKKEKLEKDVFLNIVKKISNNVDRATRIIQHMREFGRKSEVTTEEVQPNEVLTRAMEIMGHQLKLRGIKVIWDLDEHLPTVLGDASRLEQVVVNLLVNARDAIEEKAKSRGESEEDDRIILRTRSRGKIVTLEVSDTGIGIPEAIVNRIFEPFFTTKAPGKGTGLGLSISYGIIKDFGGTIDVNSKQGSGASFTIRLPAPSEP